MRKRSRRRRRAIQYGKATRVGCASSVPRKAVRTAIAAINEPVLSIRPLN